MVTFSFQVPVFCLHFLLLLIHTRNIQYLHNSSFCFIDGWNVKNWYSHIHHLLLYSSMAIYISTYFTVIILPFKYLSIVLLLAVTKNVHFYRLSIKRKVHVEFLHKQWTAYHLVFEQDSMWMWLQVSIEMFPSLNSWWTKCILKLPFSRWPYIGCRYISHHHCAWISYVCVSTVPSIFLLPGVIIIMLW